MRKKSTRNGTQTDDMTTDKDNKQKQKKYSPSGLKLWNTEIEEKTRKIRRSEFGKCGN